MDKKKMFNFIKQGFIRVNSEIDARYKPNYIGGDKINNKIGNFIIRLIQEDKDDYIFICASTYDGSKEIIRGADIIRIDGMTIERMEVSTIIDSEECIL